MDSVASPVDRSTAKLRSTSVACCAASTARTVNVWPPSPKSDRSCRSAAVHGPKSPSSTLHVRVTAEMSSTVKRNVGEESVTESSAGPSVIVTTGAVVS